MSGWQDAVGTLARQRELAESGAGLLKAHVRRDAAAMVRGQLLYGKAKAASDELIERLLLAVREGDDPGSSPSLRSAMTEAVKRRESFTEHAERHLPFIDGSRSVMVLTFIAALAAAKPAAEAVRILAETSTLLWKTWHENDELNRQAITTQLTRLRWQAFDDIPEGR